MLFITLDTEKQINYKHKQNPLTAKCSGQVPLLKYRNRSYTVLASFDTNTQVLRTIKAANVLHYGQAALQTIPNNRCRTMIYEK